MKKSILLTCCLIVLSACNDSPAGNTCQGGDCDTSGTSLIDDFTYLGAFRLTNGDFGASNINYAIGTLAYNPANHSLFIAGHDHHRAVAEFPIPALDSRRRRPSCPKAARRCRGSSPYWMHWTIPKG